MTGVIAGHQIHPAQGHRGSGRTGDPDPELGGGFAKIIVGAGIGQLTGPALVLQQHGPLPFQGRGAAGGQHLFQAVGQLKGKLCHCILLCAAEGLTAR